MPTFTGGVFGNDFDQLDIISLGLGAISNASGISFADSLNSQIDNFYGGGFVYGANGFPTAGTVSEVHEIYSGNPVFDLTGLNLPITTILGWAATGADETARLTVFAGSDLINGSNIGSRLRGYDGDDTINGGAGNDFLDGGGGNDQVFGGAGNDVVVDGSGTNYLRGGEGDDVILGGTGFDDANGNMGNDTISTGAGDDYSVGGKDKTCCSATRETTSSGAIWATTPATGATAMTRSVAARGTTASPAGPAPTSSPATGATTLSRAEAAPTTSTARRMRASTGCWISTWRRATGSSSIPALSTPSARWERTPSSTWAGPTR
jgi:hypothetical protein